MIRTIVIIVGQLRTAEINAQILRNAMTSLDNPIIMVQCPKSDALKAKSLYGTLYVDGWDPEPKLPRWLKYSWPFLGNSGKLAIKEKPSFYYQLLRQKRAAEKFGTDINPATDVIIKWRPDLRIFTPLNPSSMMNSSSIYIPEHDNHGGYNDQCAAGPAALMMKYLARIDQLKEYFCSGGICHAETFLKWSLANISIKPLPICYCIDRGSHFNPVKFCAHLGDTHNHLTVEQLINYGVPVEQPATGPTDTRNFGKFPFLEYVWQRQIASRFYRNS